MTFAPLACNADTADSLLSKTSISKTWASTDISTGVSSCHCQLVPGAGRKIEAGVSVGIGMIVSVEIASVSPGRLVRPSTAWTAANAESAFGPHEVSEMANEIGISKEGKLRYLFIFI